ncbi:MAG: histidine phosphatase family protein [Acidobacteriota bacterium]|nr:histidine phosphatase family protein [Acidobacteriota bacterium]
MKIIAIRHGETTTNAAGQITGWSEHDLTPKGIAQAQEMAGQLTAPYAALVVSPLRRTRHTAEILAARRGGQMQFDPNLRERNFGSLNGKTWDEIREETGQDIRHIDLDLLAYDYRPWGGECVADVKARVEAFLKKAPEYSGGKDMAVVTHGGIIKMLYILLAPERRRPIGNCSVHEFEI